MGSLAEDELISTRFGFFGELGYGLICWLPYLNYLRKSGLAPIKTCGPLGSSPFYYFSDDHLEIECPVLDSWGSEYELLRLQRNISERLIAPSNLGSRELDICGNLWTNNNLHTHLSRNAYEPLDYLVPRSTDLPEKYAVINTKDYYNWGNYTIRNFYDLAEIRQVAEFCKKTGLALVINRFPAPRESTSTYFSEEIVSAEMLSLYNIIDMAPLYSSITDLSERNRLQLQCLKHASVVFASQGGNAAITLLCNKNVAILMRGGFDYPDYKFLAETHEANLVMAYEPADLLKLLSNL